MVRQLYLYSIEAADFPDSVTSENTLREFPLVIATVAKVSRKRGLWRVVRVKNCQTGIDRFPSGSKFTLIEQIYKECGKRLDPGKEHQVDNKQDVERYCFFDECRGLTLCNRAGYEHQGSHRR